MSASLPAVLLLDGQTTQALACARALGRKGRRVLVASVHRWPLARWSRYCESAYQMCAESAEEFARVRAWAAASGVRVVIPLTERSAMLCTAEQSAWQAAGLTVGCAPADLLAIAFDKARTAEVALACGLRVPETRVPGSLAEAHEAAAAIGYPCIVKSRRSCAQHAGTLLQARDPSYVATPEGLDRAVIDARLGDVWPVIQPIVPGRGKGVFAVCDHGEPLAWFAHERLRDVRPSGSGSSLRRSVPLDERLRQPAERILRAMRWHGPAMVEFRDDGVSEPWLLEINGRFWGSLHLAVSAGVDFPSLWLALLEGGALPLPGSYASDVTLRWLWGDMKHLVSVIAGRPSGYTGPFPTIAEGVASVLGPQPVGTRSETWDRNDPWPAVGEWVQGVRELANRRAIGRVVQRARSARTARAAASAPDTRLSAGAPAVQSQTAPRSAEGSTRTTVPSVSVIVPCRNEVRHIRACLDSILAGDYPADRFEVLVADGASDDGTREILDGFAGDPDRRASLRVIDNPSRITPCGLNAAIRSARGEVIVRMDAHATYPPDYVRLLVAALDETGAAIVGARIDTVPAHDGALARAIALGMSHPFGVGPSRFRIGTTARCAVDHLPFFCCRRELVERIGPFDEELVRNQDGEFSSRVRRAGGEIVLIPEVVARYFARDSLAKLGRTLFQYGYFKPLTARKVGRVMTLRQLVPPVFVLALVLTGALALVSPVAALVLVTCAGTYAAAVLVACAKAAPGLGPTGALALAVVFPVMHLAYGYGYLKRLVEFALHLGGPLTRPAEIPLSR